MGLGGLESARDETRLYFGDRSVDGECAGKRGLMQFEDRDGAMMLWESVRLRDDNLGIRMETLIVKCNESDKNLGGIVRSEGWE